MEVCDSQVATHVGEEDPPTHGFILFLNPQQEEACSWFIIIYTHIYIYMYTKYSTIQYNTLQYYTILYYTLLYYTILYYTILYYTCIYKYNHIPMELEIL